MTMDQKLYEAVSARLGSRKGAHDMSHLLRVRETALRIAESENADVDVVEAMAMLHDLVRYEDYREEDSVEETLIEARKILEELNYDKKQIEEILDGISSHSLHSKIYKTPRTIEAKILFDADKIDSVGEIGIARWFMTVGGRDISVAEAASIYLNTLNKQQKKMKGRMYTDLGNKLIKEKAYFTKKFLENCIAAAKLPE